MIEKTITYSRSANQNPPFPHPEKAPCPDGSGRGRESYVEVADGIGTPASAVLDGPDVVWHHIDGPLMGWAGHIHWLTFSERLSIWLRLRTVDQVACARWPHLANLRAALSKATGGQHV